MRRMIWICWVAIASAQVPAHAQRINFALTAGDVGIELDNLGGTLNFNAVRNPIIMGTEAITISLQANQTFVVPFRIEAAEHLDVTVEVTGPLDGLVLDGHTGGGPKPTMPFQLGWAYWNRSESPEPPDPPVVQSMAREMQSPTGITLPFGSATFPMRRRADGTSPPPPPPVPAHGGMPTVNKAVAYVYVYGRIDPSAVVASGLYVGTIEINVSYANY